MNGLLIIFGLTIAVTVGNMFDDTADLIEQVANDIYLNKSPGDHFDRDAVHRMLLHLNLMYEQNYSVGGVLPTGSMRPWIDSDHHTIFVNVTNLDELQVGDVIVFNVSDSNVSILHRIIEIDGEQIITKGDNNLPRDDYNLTIENVLGKVVAVLY